MIKLKIFIPPKTGRDIRHIPSAGLARSAYFPKRVLPTVGRTIAKASKPSWIITVVRDTLLDDEMMR